MNVNLDLIRSVSPVVVDEDVLSTMPMHVVLEILWKSGKSAKEFLLFNKSWNNLLNSNDAINFMADRLKKSIFGQLKWEKMGITCPSIPRIPVHVMLDIEPSHERLILNPGSITKKEPTGEVTDLNMWQLIELFNYTLPATNFLALGDMRAQSAHWIYVDLRPKVNDGEKPNLQLMDNLLVLMATKIDNLQQKAFLVNFHKEILVVWKNGKELGVQIQPDEEPVFYEFKAKQIYAVDPNGKAINRLSSMVPEYNERSIDELKKIYLELLSEEKTLKASLVEKRINGEPIEQSATALLKLRGQIKSIALELKERGLSKEERMAFRKVLSEKFSEFYKMPDDQCVSQESDDELASESLDEASMDELSDEEVGNFDDEGAFNLEEFEECQLSDGLSTDDEMDYIGKELMWLSRKAKKQPEDCSIQ